MQRPVNRSARSRRRSPRRRCELTNPEKSLTATIGSPFRGEPANLPLRPVVERSRYRPQVLGPA